MEARYSQNVNWSYISTPLGRVGVHFKCPTPPFFLISEHLQDLGGDFHALRSRYAGHNPGHSCSPEYSINRQSNAYYFHEETHRDV